MAAPKNRTKLEREAQISQIAHLYLARQTQPEIAARLGVHVNTVKRDLRILRNRWAKESQRDIGKRKAEELARIDRLEMEYWDAWRRSLKGATERAGDPRFLAGVQWCIQKRVEIIGVDAPAQAEISIHDARDALAEFDKFVAGANVSGTGAAPTNGLC